MVFALVDCNNFYASCERLFQPHLENKPIIILSNNDGCIIARSNEAKALGFKMGDPFFLNREKIKQNHVHVFSSNYTLYGDISRRVMQTLEEYTPEVEVYSIDEAFVNLDGLQHLDLKQFSHNLRRIIKQHTGIPVSIGIGNSKTLAKLANRIAKKSSDAEGVFMICDPKLHHEALKRTKVGDIWGVGRRWEVWLNNQGIQTAYELAASDPKFIRKHMHIIGERLVWELRGVSCIPLEILPSPKKGLCVSRSFGRYLTQKEDVCQALSYHVMRAGEKLRREGLQAGHMMVFIKTNRHANKPQYSNIAKSNIAIPTNYTPYMIKRAMQLLDYIWKDGFEYNKTGIILTDLSTANGKKKDLFDTNNYEKQTSLMKVMDQINARYGSRTVQFAIMGNEQKPSAHAMRSFYRSPCYTTNWNEIPIVI